MQPPTTWALIALLASPACGAAAAPAPTAPAPAPPSCPEPPPPFTALRSDAPAADAPPELAAQFGRLVGVWRCTSEALQEDGTWKPGPGEATWTWFYTLGGHAIADVWEPARKGAPSGINLRLYDRQAGEWHAVWAAGSQRDFDHFTAKAQGDDIVMGGERFARPMFRRHQARITFHDITADAFQWRYEAATVGGDDWHPVSRLSCRRAAHSAATENSSL